MHNNRVHGRLQSSRWQGIQPVQFIFIIVSFVYARVGCSFGFVVFHAIDCVHDPSRAEQNTFRHLLVAVAARELSNNEKCQ